MYPYISKMFKDSGAMSDKICHVIQKMEKIKMKLEKKSVEKSNAYLLRPFLEKRKTRLPRSNVFYLRRYSIWLFDAKQKLDELLSRFSIFFQNCTLVFDFNNYHSCCSFDTKYLTIAKK